jgi:hypothetical protein
MKKAIVLLLALVALGVFAIAEDAPAATYEFTANADAKWQYNFDTNKSGFTNEWDLSLKYHLLNDVAKTTGGDEGTYGLIEVTHLNLNLIEETEADVGSNTAAWGDGAGDGTGDNLSISAKIVSGNLWVGLGYGAYTGDYDNAVYVPLFSEDSGYDNDSAFEPAISPAGSIQIGYKLGDMGTVSAVVGSNTAGAVNTFKQYTVGFDAALTPVKDVLAIDAGAWYNLESKMWIATAKATVTAGALTVYGAGDFAKDDTASSVTVASGETSVAWDVSGGVAFSMNEKKDSINLDAYYTKSVGTADADPVPAYNNHEGDVGLKFVDAGGFVEPLSFTVGVFADDLAGASADTLLSVAESISYKIGDLTPSEAFRYDLATKAYYLNLGVDFAGIKNTVLSADLDLGGSADDLNHVFTSGTKGKDAVLTVKAKVTL